MWHLGKTQTLQVWRTAPQGLYLGDPEDDPDVFGDEAVLLPTRWVAADMGLDALVKVFIFKDSEGRPIATTDQPAIEVGQAGLLDVLEVMPRVGVFLDWGLSKDLLLPFGEIVRADEDAPPLQPGDQAVVTPIVDRSNRLVASMRIDHHLAMPSTPTLSEAKRLVSPPFKLNQPVTALVYAHTPLGYKAIVNASHLGLIYRNETAADLPVNTITPAYIKRVYPDGRLDLRLDAAGYERVDPLAREILARLGENGGSLPFHDKSDPDVIRAAFGCSKKAFKQALGQLYKQRLIRITPTGISKTNSPQAGA